MSFWPPSSRLGETNTISEPCASTVGKGRAFPQRPTICAASVPLWSENSIQEGNSPDGAFSVISHLPVKGPAAPAKRAISNNSDSFQVIFLITVISS